MPHHEIHASGSLDNSGCKRLRISSLVDDMAEEEIQENIFDLFRVGIELLDQMRGCGMDTANWNKMLHRAFDLEVGTLAALNQVLVILRRTLAARLAAHPGGPGPQKNIRSTEKHCHGRRRCTLDQAKFLSA